MFFIGTGLWNFSTKLYFSSSFFFFSLYKKGYKKKKKIQNISSLTILVSVFRDIDDGSHTPFLGNFGSL